VRLEGLDQLKNPMTSGIETTPFGLVAKCLNQLNYRMPRGKKCLPRKNFAREFGQYDVKEPNTGE
jgi:hypothetical protein